MNFWEKYPTAYPFQNLYVYKYTAFFRWSVVTYKTLKVSRKPSFRNCFFDISSLFIPEVQQSSFPRKIGGHLKP